MAKACGIKLGEISLRHLFGVKDLKDLEARYQKDSNLGNINSERFEGLFGYQEEKAGGPSSTVENAEMYKHCLIYQVLGVQPEFTDH